MVFSSSNSSIVRGRKAYLVVMGFLETIDIRRIVGTEEEKEDAEISGDEE
jgi:hypothetical protein